MKRSDRVRRGFHRLGLALAAPFAAAFVLIAPFTLYAVLSPAPVLEYSDTAEESRARGDWFHVPTTESLWRRDAHFKERLYLVLALAGCATGALLGYGVPRLIGWIVAGFMD